MLQLSHVLEHINNLVVILTPQGEVRYVSPSSQKILGYAPTEILGENWSKTAKTPN